MKILLLNYKYSITGGSEQYFIFQIKELIKNGYEVFVICSDENRIHLKNVKCYYIPHLNKITLTAKNILKVRKILKREKPDIAYIHNNDNPFLNYYISRTVPSIKFIHSYDHVCPVTSKYICKEHMVCDLKRGAVCFEKCIEYSLRNFYIILKNFIEPLAYLKYKKIVVFSDCVKKNFLKIYKNEIVKFIYYSEYQQCNKYSDFNDNIILFVGRFIRAKGIYELIDICAQLNTNYILYLVGDGQERESLIAYAHDKKVNFKFFGWLSNDQIKKLYENASVLAVPSIWPEPFGIIGLEAMSFKVPVVAFNNGGISEWLKNEYNGYLIDNNSIEMFAEKLNILLKDKSACREMGKNGFELLHSKFNRDRSIQFFLDINKELLT